MMIAVFQNMEFQNLVKSIHPDIDILDKTDKKFLVLLHKYLKKYNTSVLIIDSEICFSKQNKHHDLEGLKLAFMLRTNPELKFFGAIKLFGFLKKEEVLKNPYSSLISDDNCVYYYRYPDEINFKELPYLSEENWLKCADRLDYNFITEFRKLEHSFQNIRISSADDLSEKENEINAYYNTIKQINIEYIISHRYANDFNKILDKFNKLMKSFASESHKEISDNLLVLKSQIKTFKQKYTENIK